MSAMSLPLSRYARIELSASRYPATLKWVAMAVASIPLLLSTLPWWASGALVASLPLLLQGWRPTEVRTLAMQDGALWVSSHRKVQQQLERPGRVLRLGPWLALQTPRGWWHLFEDQAPLEQLQPYYQWLWLNRQR